MGDSEAVAHDLERRVDPVEHQAACLELRAPVGGSHGEHAQQRERTLRRWSQVSELAPDATQPGGETGARRRGVAYTTYVITVAVLLLAIAVVVFVVQNDAQVSIWLFGSTKVMSVAGALAVSAAAGLAVGLMIGLVPQLKLRRELRALRRNARGRGDEVG